MKNIKKGPILIFIIGLLIIGGIAYISPNIIHASSKSFQLGKLIGQNIANENAEKIVMKVNNISVTQSELENLKVILQIENPNKQITDTEVESQIIAFNALYHESKIRGLEATKEDAKEYAKYMKQSLTDPVNAPDNSELILEYIDGTGQSVDQFFEKSTNAYQKMLSIANLRKSVYDEVANNLPEQIETNEKLLLQEEAFNKIKETVAKGAIVEHL